MSIRSAPKPQVYRMSDHIDFEEPHDRLKRSREAAGYESAAEFARRYELGEATYRHHENGTRGFNLPTAQSYARKLNIDAYWLMTGRLPRGAGAATVPVVGYVGAGAEIYSMDDHHKGGGLDEVPAPPGSSGNEVALVVRGDSMYPAYHDGDTIYYNEHADTEDKLLGRECVVRMVDGRTMIKTVTRGSRIGSYTLLSHNAQPITDVALEWAARVQWVRKS
jgi:phage repressor protein C with HTH and peptisase S24 domain